MSYSYLANPYSHPDKLVEQERYETIRRICGQLAFEGLHVYSPIVHWHEVARHHDLPTDAAFWRESNETMLLLARELLVVTLPGWKQSKGVRHEIDFARLNNIRISYLHFNPKLDSRFIEDPTVPEEQMMLFPPDEMDSRK